MTEAAPQRVVDTLDCVRGFMRARVIALPIGHDSPASKPVLRQPYLDKRPAARKGWFPHGGSLTDPRSACAGSGCTSVTAPSPHLTVTGTGPQRSMMATPSGSADCLIMVRGGGRDLPAAPDSPAP
jgi:hypothetical protein